MARRKSDLKGMQFGRLTAIEFDHQDKHKKSVWRFSCICGKTSCHRAADVLAGKTTSCGCITTSKEHCPSCGRRL